MPSASDIKNVSKAAKQLKGAATDLKKAKDFWKAFRDDTNSKIKNTTATLMVGFALLLDLTQALVALLDAGYVSGPAAIVIQFMVYTLWFRLHGVSYWGKSKAASKVISFLVEEIGGLIPYVNLLMPATTVMVVAAIGITRVEEAGQATDTEATPAISPEIKEGKRGGADKPTATVTRRRGEPGETPNPEIKRPKRVPQPAIPGGEQNPYLNKSNQKPANQDYPPEEQEEAA